MTNSSVLKETWATLEAESDQLPGLYERRVFVHTGFAIFAALIRPSKQIRLGFSVSADVNTEGLDRETKGFRVLRQYIAQERTSRIWMELTQSSFRELFEIMTDDVAARILSATDETSAVSALRQRLNHWERFMSASGPDGLSREKQIGLFGELTFLRTMLAEGISATSALEWWHGPISENQDFQAGKLGLEVKATTGNSPKSVRISNELQLDDSDCEPLYLFHLWLRQLEGAGVTLPQMVDDIVDLVGDVLEQLFKDQVEAAGYHEIHRKLYEETGYIERARTYYGVKNNFPRICRSDLRSGVSRVEYQIDLAGFEPFTREESSVLQSFAKLQT
jgi:hypothetical protein